MSKYTVKISPAGLGRYHNKLTIVHEASFTEYEDGGEPEDSSLLRDWSWVKDELERAYKLGLEDGRNGQQ